MISLEIVDAAGNTITLRAKSLISINGQPYGAGPAENNIVDRLVLLEAQVADLTEFRDVLLSHQPKPETPT